MPAPLTEWQPIETAPKDSSKTYLGWGPGWSEVEKILWNSIATKFVIVDWEGHMLAHYDQFTHWMPLPEPPK